MVTTRRGTNTTSGATAKRETFHSPDAPSKRATYRGKKRTGKRTNEELEVTQNDNGAEGPPKKKTRLEDSQSIDYEGQQKEKEEEPKNTG